MNVLQGYRIHTPSLFCSVIHHNLPVLFESRILYLLACSEHRCTCCAQTIKQSTGSCVQRAHNGPSAGCIGVLKGRRERDIARLPASVQIAPALPTVTALYSGKWIPWCKKSGRDSCDNADLDCSDVRLSFVGALHWAAAFRFNCSVL